jgi:MarR family transcriptional regulator, organic hydroperoxide resistance regulator
LHPKYICFICEVIVSGPAPRLFLLLDRAAHAVRQRLERRARDELGVSTVQLGALFHLTGHDGCLHKELADALGIQPAAVSGLVDRMAAAGLVQRRICADDGRAQRLHATAAGKRIAGKARPVVAGMQAALVAGFSGDEIAIIARFLAMAAERALWPAPLPLTGSGREGPP